MNGVTISYEVRMERLRRFGRRRFALRLYADGVETGYASLGLTAAEAQEEAKLLLDDPQAVLDFYGLTERVAADVYVERGYRMAGVRPGDMVKLRHGTGPFIAGYRCEVLHVDLTEDWDDLDEYPVVVMPFLSRKEIELQVDEFDKFTPLGVQAWGRH